MKGWMTMTLRLGLVLVLVFAMVGLEAKKPVRPTATTGISLNASEWDVRYSSGVSRLQNLNGMAGWVLDFPDDGGSLNYVTTPYGQPLTGAITMTLQIVPTSGEPVFQSTGDPNNTCDNPPSVRAYFERRTKGNKILFAPESYRWWAKFVAVELGLGVATLTIPLTPDQWSNTFGRIGTDDPEGFATALANPGAIGMTFGGGCFFGHGVYVEGGTARFILTNYAVTP